MAPSKTKTVTVKKTATVSATKSSPESPYKLDPEQTLRAAKALVRKIQTDTVTATTSSTKASLLADADSEDVSNEVPVWLVLTTKKHIIDKKRLKPGKIQLPHPYLNAEQEGGAALRICLITADPQRRFKDLIAEPSFPVALSKNIQRVIGTEKLKAKYSSFESRRKLLGEYDVFLADDRVITLLPKLLGKVFYGSAAKRPIPVSLEGKRQSVDSETGVKRQKLSEGGSKVTKSDPKPADIAAEITKTLSSTLVHLAPSTTTAVKVGISTQTPDQIDANITAVVTGLVEKYVPQKWRNVRAIHIKGPNTAALPIWMTTELWTAETDVLEQEPTLEGNKKRKRGALTSADCNSDVIEVPGPDGKIRRLENPNKDKSAPEKKKRKSDPVAELAAVEAAETEKVEKAARKEALKAQKQAARADVSVEEKKVAKASVNGDGEGKGKKKRLRASDLM
jgi:ribosome biogenesis protein UTP30